MNKLISNTEFGDYLESIGVSNSCYRMNRKLFDKFLSKKLSLEMFVPCKLVEGVWLPIEYPNHLVTCNQSIVEYQKAKDRCLFKGFQLGEFSSTIEHKSVGNIFVMYKSNGVWFKNTNGETIEDLTRYNLTLTASAKKQIGL